jgi:hypothetical protein
MKRILLPLLLLPSSVALIVGLSSSSNGAGASQSADRTGSPVSSGTCANCHSGGSSVPGLSVQLLDNGNPVTSYQPDKDYTLKVTVSGSEYQRFGFQAVALDGADEQAGSLTAVSSGTRVLTLAGRQYGEHTNPVAGGVFEMTWKAPASGKGTVKVFTAGLGAKSPSSSDGDRTATNLLTLNESAGSNVSNSSAPAMLVYPNPAENLLFFGSEKLKDVTVTSVDGRVVMAHRAATDKITVSALPAGLYLIQGSRADGSRVSARFFRS